MHSKWFDVAKVIVDSVRMKARSIERFRTSKQGCIRICAYPNCIEADEWFGGLSTFNENGDDIVDYELSFPISFGGSRVAEFDEPEGKVYVDTYGVTAMKIADCSRAQDLGMAALSGLPYAERQNDDPECGYGKWCGAFCAEVYKVDEIVGKIPFCGIYISVSGADASDDLKCAMYAANVIKDFFRAEGANYQVDIPPVCGEMFTP